MLTRSQTKQTIPITTVTRSTRTPYYLRNLPIINYFETDDDDDYENDFEDDYENVFVTGIDFSYNNDDMPGPYDDIGRYCHSGYCDYCGSSYYDGYNGYDN
jgi:hypothetical protein